MNWPLGEFLFWLVLAIFVPAVVVHFTKFAREAPAFRHGEESAFFGGCIF